jgi:glycosyltransferase involved in cell wall biosynthesis
MPLPLVTVAIPVYRRLELLPAALRSVAAQDYDRVELLVSDNGMDGGRLRDLVASHYPGPFRLRANPVTVSVAEHFNQLLAAADGEYFVLLCDDDEISPDFVSELAGLLRAHPRANVAIARPETVDGDGHVDQLRGEWPTVLEGEEFLRGWTTKRIRLASTVTLLVRRDVALARGGYLELPRALLSDNVLLLRLALGGEVVLGERCRFRWRIDDASTGFSASYRETAAACREFLHFLDHDAELAALLPRDPAAAHQLRALFRMQCATWFFFRWRNRYSTRLGTAAWVRAAFSMPFIPGYYRMVGGELLAYARTGQRGPAGPTHTRLRGARAPQ